VADILRFNIKIIKMMSKNLKIVFIGTPEFGAVVLERLIKNNYKPILVITALDKPVGRKQIITPPTVKLVAQRYNIPVAQPAKIRTWNIEPKILKPDLLIVTAYGQIIPKNILDIPKFGCLNIHPSLLPKYRGASPIQNTILNGDRKTGVTIILMDERMDHGPILVKRELEIPRLRQGFGGQANPKITYQKLHDELAKLGAELLIETIPNWIGGKIKPELQDGSKATYTKIIKKEDGKINWSKTAEEIERQIRAFNHWPGSFSEISNFKSQTSKPKCKIIKIIKAEIGRLKSKNKPGKIFLLENNELAVMTGQNCLILQKLQIEGRKPITAEEFIRGHKYIIGKIFDS